MSGSLTAQQFAELSRISRDARFHDADGTSLAFLAATQPELWTMYPGYTAWLSNLANDVELITAEYPFIPTFLRRELQWEKPIVVTCIDNLSTLHGKGQAAVAAAILQSELNNYAAAVTTMFLTESDAAAFRQHGVIGRVVPLTGDSQVPQATYIGSLESRLRQLGIQSPFVMFVGSQHRPNTEAARYLQAIAPALDKAQVVVVGTCFPKTTSDRFVSLGAVSDVDLSCIYTAAEAVVIPLMEGGGMSAKFFEAAACGKAIVATEIGARGFQCTPGEHYLKCNDISEFAHCINGLLEAPETVQSLSKNAPKFACDNDIRLIMAPYVHAACKLTDAVASDSVRKRVLAILDDNLTGLGGHHLSYLEAVAEAAARLGWEIRGFASASFTAEVRNATIVSCFRGSYHDPVNDNPFPRPWNINRVYDLLVSNKRFHGDVISHLGRLGPNDLVFLPNASHRQMLAIAAWLHGLLPGFSPQVVLLFRYDTSLPAATESGERCLVKDAGYIESLKIGFRHLEDTAALGRVRIATDSSLLAEELSTITVLPVEVLPIPHSRLIATQDATRKKTSPVRVGFLGDARAEKGFHLLPDIIRGCSGCNCTFAIQAYISSHYHNAMKPFVDELGRISAGVEIVDRPLDDDAYRLFLDTLDLVLLPYDPLTYARRTSGPFVEAICAEKPVVHPSGTWMSSESLSVAGCVAFEHWVAIAISEAVAMAARNFYKLRAELACSAPLYRKYHLGDSFVSRLCALTRNDDWQRAGGPHTVATGWQGSL